MQQETMMKVVHALGREGGRNGPKKAVKLDDNQSDSFKIGHILLVHVVQPVRRAGDGMSAHAVGDFYRLLPLNKRARGIDVQNAQTARHAPCRRERRSRRLRGLERVTAAGDEVLGTTHAAPDAIDGFLLRAGRRHTWGRG